jgi:glucose uptake protein GlcU
MPPNNPPRNKVQNPSTSAANFGNPLLLLQVLTLFILQNHDVVQQLIVGFGFRVTGYRFPNHQDDNDDNDDSNKANTRSLLITSRDSFGVQIIVMDNTTNGEEDSPSVDDQHLHFDGGKL